MPDQPPLRRLIYRSTSRITGGPSAVALELGRILETSRRRNPENGLTGALMLREQRFVQVLEGPDASVGETLGRIAVDPRHGDLEMLEDGGAAARVFGDWTMAYAGEFGLPDIPLSLSLVGSILSDAQTAMLGKLRAYLGNT